MSKRQVKITIEWDDGIRREYHSNPQIDASSFNFETRHPQFGEIAILSQGEDKYVRWQHGMDIPYTFMEHDKDKAK